MKEFANLGAKNPSELYFISFPADKLDTCNDHVKCRIGETQPFFRGRIGDSFTFHTELEA